MRDERAVEVMAQWLWDQGRTRITEAEPFAAKILAVLRGAGFDIYRPDDCEKVEVKGCDRGHDSCLYLEHYPQIAKRGEYRLIPVRGS